MKQDLVVCHYVNFQELVKASKMLAQRHNFEYSCSDEAGRLLSVFVG